MHNFIDMEFCFSSLSPVNILIYIAIAVLCRMLMPSIGNVALLGKYKVKLSQFSNDEESVWNVAFRLIAPVVLCYGLLWISVGCSVFLGHDWIPRAAWLPLCFYWIIYIIIVLVRNRNKYPVWTLIVQAVASSAIGIICDWQINSNLAEEGISFFVQTNLGWEVSVLLFFSCCAIILHGFRQTTSDAMPKGGREDSDRPDSSSLNMEKKIWSYIRKYNQMLPLRFQQDLLLRAFFYSVMYIEDSNRPWYVRQIEKLLFHMGIIKSTGIMQVRSKRYLSNEESIKKAFTILIQIWDSFIKNAAKDKYDHQDSVITFTGAWYRYKYMDLKYKVLSNNKGLYGQYSGSQLLDISSVFSFVSIIIEMNEGINDKALIYVKSDLFSDAARWNKDNELYMDNNAICVVDSEVPDYPFVYNIYRNDSPSSANVEEALGILSEHGFISAFEYVPGMKASLIFCTRYKDFGQLAEDKITEWKIVCKRNSSGPGYESPC